MKKRWRIRAHDAGRINDLARAVSIPPVLAQLLLSRGIHDPGQARVFLEARLNQLRDPDELPGIPEASEIVFAAIRDRRRIVIYGDYDVDGMTGTALLYRCFKLLGAEVTYYVPSRLEEGYGLNADALRKLAADGASLVITVDCGINAVEPVRIAREIGLDVIITDHHTPGPQLPEATAIVHPLLPGHFYPFSGLSGSGVALKLAWSLCRKESGSARVSDRLRDALLQAVGLAALGTVADVVPLLDENRILVRHGLTSLRQRPTLGMKKLMDVAMLTVRHSLSSDDLAFGIAPRLNAAGRFGQAQLAVELLVSDNPDRAQALAEYLDELNNNRKSLETSIYLAAHKQAKERFDPRGDAALVLADRGWHSGVIGIVAGRLAEKYHRPVVLIAFDEHATKPGTGSARSIPGFNLYEAFVSCSQHLLKHGGHAAAAGLTIEEEKVDAFRDEFCEYASREIATEDLQAKLFLDGEVPLAAFTLKAVDQLEDLAPYGASNPKPTWCTTGVRLAGKPKRIGKDGRHLMLRVRQHEVTFRAVAFGGGEWEESLNRIEGSFDIAFQPEINIYGGRRAVQLHIVDWQCDNPPAPVTQTTPSNSTTARDDEIPF